MLSPGVKNVGNGRFVRLPHGNIFSRNGVCACGCARESGERSSATKHLNRFRNKIVTEFFVQESATVASVKNKFAGGRVDTSYGNEVGALPTSLKIGKLMASQNANAPAIVRGRHILKTKTRRTDIREARSRNAAVVNNWIPKERAGEPQFTKGIRVNAPKRVLVRSEEHTSELQSQSNLVCRLLLEKKKK